jgi:hypothetical protein
LRSQKEVCPIPNFNVKQEKISPKVSPARIHHDIANLPGIIQIMGPQNAKSALVELAGSDGPIAAHCDAQLQSPSNWAISGRG